MVDGRKILASKITKSAIEGDSVEITSRQIRLSSEPPFEVDDKRFYIAIGKDNADAVIKKEPTKMYIGGAFGEDKKFHKFFYVLTSKDDKIRGDKIDIKTSDNRIRNNNNIATINESGRHKAQNIITKSITFCELMLEDKTLLGRSDIDKIREYKKLHELSNEMIFLDAIK